MSTDHPAPSTTTRLGVGDSVRFETPRGDTRTGAVVGVVWSPTVSQLGRFLVVAAESSTYRVRAAEAARATTD